MLLDAFLETFRTHIFLLLLLHFAITDVIVVQGGREALVRKVLLARRVQQVVKVPLVSQDSLDFRDPKVHVDCLVIQDLLVQ